MDSGRSIQHEISSLKGTPLAFFNTLLPQFVVITTIRSQDRPAFPQSLSGKDFLMVWMQRKQKSSVPKVSGLWGEAEGC